MSDASLDRVLIIIPTYDEIENLESIVARTRAANPDVDVLVVDDSSPDGTAEVVRRLAEELGGIDLEAVAGTGDVLQIQIPQDVRAECPESGRRVMDRKPEHGARIAVPAAGEHQSPRCPALHLAPRHIA